MLPTTEVDEKITQLIGLLKQRLEPDGQNLSCFLEGLYHSRYPTYWEYLQLELLLNLQHPRTSIPDELVFITYHQITELYFKLILAEIGQVTAREDIDAAFFAERIGRVNRYLQNLVYSFDIMAGGMDREQFQAFRTALSPASGFQSYQFRVIEIISTGLANLRELRYRNETQGGPEAADLYDQIYWKQGATVTDTGKKDMSLILFERQYDPALRQRAADLRSSNLEAQLSRIACDDPGYEHLRASLRTMDQLVNIDWRLSHFRSAARHLSAQNGDLKATGSTNWRQYLPPRFQKLMFFPALWSAEERAEWGRSYVEALFQ